MTQRLSDKWRERALRHRNKIGGWDVYCKINVCADEYDEAHPNDARASAVLARLWEWTSVYGKALCPPSGCADTFGEGVREMKYQVRNIITRRLSDEAHPPISAEWHTGEPPEDVSPVLVCDPDCVDDGHGPCRPVLFVLRRAEDVTGSGRVWLDTVMGIHDYVRWSSRWSWRHLPSPPPHPGNRIESDGCY